MPTPARIVLGSDHAGFALKEIVKKHLLEKKIDVLDEGTFSEASVDYPAIMRKACARALEIGAPAIIFGGSGNGDGGEWGDYWLECIAGREKGRQMTGHGEYMHRHGWTAVSAGSDGEDR